jgi:hypothetical protein
MVLCRAILCVCVPLACVTPAIVARTSFAQDTGMIEGHVYGADTNGPLRVGNVLLKIAPAGKESRVEANFSGMAKVFGGGGIGDPPSGWIVRVSSSKARPISALRFGARLC